MVTILNFVNDDDDKRGAALPVDSVLKYSACCVDIDRKSKEYSSAVSISSYILSGGARCQVPANHTQIQ